MRDRDKSIEYLAQLAQRPRKRPAQRKWRRRLLRELERRGEGLRPFELRQTHDHAAANLKPGWAMRTDTAWPAGPANAIVGAREQRVCPICDAPLEPDEDIRRHFKEEPCQARARRYYFQKVLGWQSLHWIDHSLVSPSPTGRSLAFPGAQQLCVGATGRRDEISEAERKGPIDWIAIADQVGVARERDLVPGWIVKMITEYHALPMPRALSPREYLHGITSSTPDVLTHKEHNRRKRRGELPR